MNYQSIVCKSRPHVRLSDDNRIWAAFEAIIAFGKMVRPVSDDSESNDLFSINVVILATNFYIGKVL
jgi:hypothetical protein